MIRRCGFVALAVCVLTSLAQAQKPASFLDAESAGPDFKVQGEYEGTIGQKTKVGAQVGFFDPLRGDHQPVGDQARQESALDEGS